MRRIKYIVLHCTATASTATVEAIKNGWKRLGWKNPGYHYLIDDSGEVHQLATEDKVTNGVRGYNPESIHVSYIGGLLDGKPADTRTPEQLDAMEELVRKLKAKYPSAKIKGHRDFSPDTNKNGKVDFWERIKECPCFEVSEWLKEVNI